MKVAVVGAGVAGISCASALQQAGCDVVLFDKARGPGGRMTSKRSAYGYMDFGAQYFTVRHPLFQQQVATWQQQGLVSRWLAPIYRYQQAQLIASPDEQQRYIGVPAMHSPLKWQAQCINSQYECRITALTPHTEGWQLLSEAGQLYGPFQQVVLSMPPVQTTALLSMVAALSLPEARLQPVWAVTLVLAEPSGHPAGGVFVSSEHYPLSWISRHNSKPGRAQIESWLLHFSPSFSAENLEQPPAFWQQQATRVLTTILAQPVKVADVICHRWLYAQMNTADTSPLLNDTAVNGVWLAGDWTRGGRVENAWLSGIDVATKITAQKQDIASCSIG